MNVSPNTGVRRETVTDFSRRQLAQHNLFLTLFRIDLSEMSKVREQGKVNVGRQGQSGVCTSVENPDAIVA
jgi:hypothetical protein